MNEEQMKALLAAMMKPFSDQLGALAAGLDALQKRPVESPKPESKADPKPDSPKPDPKPDPALPPEVNAQLAAERRQREELAKQVEALQKANQAAVERAQKAAREAAVTNALGGFSFASDSARATAGTLLDGQIRQLEDGSLVAGANPLPVADYVKDWLPQNHAYLLAPTGVSGAGGVQSTQLLGSKPATTEMIKPGMSKEDEAAVWAAIGRSINVR